MRSIIELGKQKVEENGENTPKKSAEAERDSALSPATRPRNSSRRQFMAWIGAAGIGATASPAIRATSASYSQVAGSNQRVRVAVMGTNSRGDSLAASFARLPGAEVVSICDVDSRAIAKTQDKVEKLQKSRPKGVTDLRRVLDDQSVDALIIAAPDHWHAPAAILALEAGKHVYVEKPCSHNPREGELLVEATRKHKRVVQMGNQRRSYPPIIEAIGALQSGMIGRVYYSRSCYNNNRAPIGIGKRVAVPEWLDYELWQGPAPRRPYLDNRIHYNWHWFWHWATGESGNNAIHSMDLCRWGMDVQHPVLVSSAGGRYGYQGDDWEAPDTQTITLEFEGGKAMLWEGLSCSRLGYPGPTFHGEGGSMLVTDDGYTVYDEKAKIVKEVSGGATTAVDLTGPGFGGDAPHLNNFLKAITSGEKLNSPIDQGHTSTMLCHLGNIALRKQRTLHCDGRTGRILRDPDAMTLWAREYEPGWWTPKS
jgi:predicted dehydrogenase